jgi:hypothetical protein
MWIAFPVGVGVGVIAGGRTPTEAVALTGLTAGITFAISRGGLTATWAAIQAVGGMSLFGFGGAVLGGAIVGTSLSYLLFGKEGAKAAARLYTGQVKVFSVAPDSYLGTIAQAPGRVAASIAANRAVANNAAGLPTGTNLSTLEWQQRQEEFMAPDPTHQYADWWGTN